ncbi:MAG: MFS transporter [bacterium]|nr:MFS transporter [bacterium]
MNASRSLNSGKNSFLIQMIPVMLCFFAMGFVDLVGTASNYVQKDLGLTDAEANLFPSLVFFWFLIFAVPTGILMNRIGRKHTVLVSLVVTTASLILPIFGDSYGIMLAAFSFLGIGNAIMQTSLNPLVTNLISEDKLASTLTFGQFVKAIASFLAPILAAWGATTSFPTFGLGWRALFVIYAVFSFLSISMLAATPIEEEQSDKASGVGACLQLLRKPFIVLCFIGIMCHVGIDVGTNTTAPKILMERLSLPLEEAGIATSVYFIFRTIGCFTGAFVLSKLSARHFFGFSVALMLVAIGMLFVCDTLYPIYIAIGLIGFGNSNIFSIILSQALMKEPKERNEVSGLMIMGLFGGTVFPLAMGFAADALGQTGAIGVMSAGVAYLLYYTIRIK